MSFLIRRLYDELRVRKCERESVGYYLEVIYFDIKPLDRPTVLPTEVRTLAKEAWRIGKLYTAMLFFTFFFNL
jgi:hypothetical protein